MAARIVPGPDSIWGLAFPAIVWSVHFLWCYVVNAVACARGVGSEEVFGLAAIQANVVAATVVLAPLLLLSLGTAIARLRDPALRESNPDTSESTEAAERLFLARATFAISALSLVAMAAVASPALFFTTCG